MMQQAKIVRIWHGAVPIDKADQYYSYLKQTGMNDYTSTPGNQGLYVLRRDEDQISHYLLVTLWDSVQSIRKFAGENYEQARYYPEDKQYLLEQEPFVTHYQLMFQQ